MKLFNWVRDPHDHRDHLYHEKFGVVEHAASLPAKVDLRPGFDPCYDQGDLGSCTANAILGAFQYLHKKNGGDATMMSRLFLYYNERAVEGTVREDAGAQIRDGIKVLAKQGVCHETEWPYIVESFKKKPSAKCYEDAKVNTITDYTRITSFNAALHCLAAGHPFVFGMIVYPEMESEQVEKTGVVPMPDMSQENLGGHAVCAVGYDMDAKHMIIRNSWGTSWGMDGYFTLPFDYFKRPDLVSDMWMIRK